MGKGPRSSAVVSMAAAVPAAGLATADLDAEVALDLNELLLRAKQGDEAAFADIVARFERMVRGVILRMTHDADLSDDLAQDVFFQFWRVLPAFTSAVTLPSWMKKVAINDVISHWRREESQRHRIQAMVDAFGPRDVRSPVATIIEEEDRDQVRAALEMLPADLRSVLSLRIYENMSYEELAESLGLEVGTVRSRLFRARQMIRDVLDRWRQHEAPQTPRHS